MNAADPVLPPVHGRVDGAGRLIEAESRLLELNAGAGGTLGEPIAVPQIATLARLAQRLGILISRGVFAADGDDDIDLWVRAQPDGDGVRLAITGWRARPAWTLPAAEAAREQDFIRSDADWQWEADAALRLTFISADAVTRSAIEPTTMLGQPLTRLFALGADRDGDLPILGALASRQGFADQPAILRRTGRPVRLAAAPRTDASGGFAGFVGAVRIDDPVATSSLVAGGLSQAFTTRLDRALRSPLGLIIANADSINAASEGPLKSDYAEYAADIASAGRHLLGLVDDLVDLQAVERPDFTIAADPIDFADIARRAAGLLGVRAADAGVMIDKPAIEDELPATGEFRRVLQILVNLIGNAVRYSPRGGTVWITSAVTDTTASLTVADQGKGIAPEDQARIFEKFERVDPSEPGGSGLGLYIARRLARAMGGDITLESVPAEGACFTLTLPRT